MNVFLSTTSLRPTALALILMGLLAALPAQAGQTCILNDGNPNNENLGGSSATGTSIACGFSNQATEFGSSSVGFFNQATGVNSSSFGAENRADGDHSTAIGDTNKANGAFSSSLGFHGTASGFGSLAIGSWTGSGNFNDLDLDTNGDNILDANSQLTVASGNRAIAIGAASRATSIDSLAIGNGNVARGNFAIAVGTENDASAINATAIGRSNVAFASSTAIGFDNGAVGQSSTAVGQGNFAAALSSTALGLLNVAKGASSTAIGNFSHSEGNDSQAMGSWFDADGNNFADHDVDADSDGIFESSSEFTTAFGDRSVAIGSAAWGLGTRAVGLGAGAFATGADSVAIGSNSRADEDNVVSVGSVGNERRIVNVAEGTQATDAVNKSQLDAHLNTAKAYTDTAVATGGTKANAYTDDREKAVRQDMQAGDAQTLSAANAYTDKAIANLDFSGLNDRFDAIDRRFGRQDQRISRVGAMGLAVSSMNAHAVAGDAGRGRLALGLGTQGGEQAVSIGYGKTHLARDAVAGRRLQRRGKRRERGLGFGFVSFGAAVNRVRMSSNAAPLDIF